MIDKLSDADRDFLGDVPDLGELEGILKLMLIDRCLGSNGITPKVLRVCWHFIGEDFLEMVKCYWETGTIALKILEGIIKLISKSSYKQEIMDWRPITLVNIIYKLIAKLLAECLGLLLLDLIC